MDDLLNGDLMDEQADEESDDEEDDESLASMEDDDDQGESSSLYYIQVFLLVCFSDEGEAHAMDLAKLQKTDPEFYKYLQDNDRELLDFKAEDMEFEDDEEMDETDEKPVLTSEILKTWQRSLIEVRRSTRTGLCVGLKGGIDA